MKEASLSSRQFLIQLKHDIIKIYYFFSAHKQLTSKILDRQRFFSTTSDFSHYLNLISCSLLRNSETTFGFIDTMTRFDLLSRKKIHQSSQRIPCTICKSHHIIRKSQMRDSWTIRRGGKCQKNLVLKHIINPPTQNF